MCPTLADPALMHDDDLVRMLDRGKAVCHHDRRPSGHQLLQSLLNPLFCLGVDICRRLVQNQDRRVKRQSPGEGKELSLTCRESGSPFGHPFMILSRQPLDEVVCVDLMGCLPYGLVADFFLAQPDIAGDISGKQEYILLHLSDGGAQLFFFSLRISTPSSRISPF